MIRFLSVATCAALGSSLAAAEPIDWLDDDRVKVTAEIRHPDSARDHVKAQITLMKLAKKACGKDSEPLSEGSLHLDRKVADNPKKGLILSEVYVCVAK